MSDDPSVEKLKLVLETWKKSIEVQEHFNEICMKIRNFYITITSGLLALIGVIVSRSAEPFFEVWPLEVHTAIPVILAIVMATLLFYFIDRHWYHRLLVGAVLNASKIEKEFGDRIPGLNLTKSIGDQSPLDVSAKGWGNTFWYWVGRAFGSDPRIRKEKKIHSDAKIAIFYKSIFTTFIIILLVISLSGGIRWPTETESAVSSEQSDSSIGAAAKCEEEM